MEIFSTVLTCCLSAVSLYCLAWGFVILAIIAKRVDQRMEVSE